MPTTSTVFPLLFFLCHCSTAYGLIQNWRDYIHPDMLENSEEHQGRYDSDMMEGDMVGFEKPEQFLCIHYQKTPKGAANAVDDTKLLWPNNTIPYEFTRKQFATFSTKETAFVVQSMALISQLTNNCIKFVRRSTEEDYIVFQRGIQCMSSIGRTGSRQQVWLSQACMQHHGDVQHELMHTMGFLHEQSRSDRDNYVTIIWDNISEDNREQFQKYDTGITYGLPYDYESVMHYAYNAFAKDNSTPTIVPKVKRAKVGQNENLSTLDVVRIQKCFRCSTATGSGLQAKVSQQASRISQLEDEIKKLSKDIQTLRTKTEEQDVTEELQDIKNNCSTVAKEVRELRIYSKDLEKKITATPAAGSTAVSSASLARLQILLDSTNNTLQKFNMLISNDNNNAPPIGSIVAFATETAQTLPRCWMRCEGETFSTEDFPQLAKLFPSGVLPNLSGRFPLGRTTAHPLCATGGEETHELTIQEMPSHWHAVENGGRFVTFNNDAVYRFSSNIHMEGKEPLGIFDGWQYTAKAGGSEPHNNMPPFYAVLYFIRAC
ncbi:zinc metalloproteinase nas-14-like isoform X2 [Paramacrobiotus metropolitanus]|uniref:zinc metalloproteinase nas-14-like isoform X2 n=1 Tax=Paramacrobiotus metropolitanus TaxID=2943436 RepID=UPI002446242A|nr:zinc metalloproteinase nas-14-like isoform X2 [Paramacrobiotus metropolitanus]